MGVISEHGRGRLGYHYLREKLTTSAILSFTYKLSGEICPSGQEVAKMSLHSLAAFLSLCVPSVSASFDISAKTNNVVYYVSALCVP